ncbi:MAG: hypothetical protein A2428_08605 [Bdellovibrionales bacterium RIFOXYC1_FULL_54_43]|nr:MAG: hypothetical protein A2428_08605 [Bdellovibrionales bacterium RIFOXYC1_FULL_54_43]OFZ84278.1 MAG: hypothetical protein A2603_15185 [Bdellovibrionales bacterium RIFOXYD1_FULL_55_31]
MTQDILTTITSDLRERFGCHTIILYGSHARGDHTEDSDVDVIGFGPVQEITPRAYFIGTIPVDAWAYPENQLVGADRSLLHIRGGRVLFEKGSAGSDLLKRLDDLYAAGPPSLSQIDREHRQVWAKKMLKRSSGNKAEDLFRRTWLMTDALENYFVLRNRWYEGPKQAINWLAKNDPSTFVLFESVLQAGTLTPSFQPLVMKMFDLPKASQLSEHEFTRYVVLLSHAKPELLPRNLAQQHVNYLKHLENEGLLELCGPFSTYKGGMVILRVASESEARTIAEADPFVQSGAQSYEIRKWELSCRANKHMGLG